jgi:hypothetical protein
MFPAGPGTTSVAFPPLPPELASRLSAAATFRGFTMVAAPSLPYARARQRTGAAYDPIQYWQRLGLDSIFDIWVGTGGLPDPLSCQG